MVCSLYALYIYIYTHTHKQSFKHPFSRFIKNNKMLFSFLIYSNNLSSACFEQSYFSSSGGSYCICSTLTVLAASRHKCMVNTMCCKYSNCLLMKNGYSIRNMQKINFSNKLSKKKCILFVLIKQVYHDTQSRECENPFSPLRSIHVPNILTAFVYSPSTVGRKLQDIKLFFNFLWTVIRDIFAQ